LKDALLRAFQASEYIGAVAVLVHALDNDRAADIYLMTGFQKLPHGNRTFFLPMATIKQALDEALEDRVAATGTPSANFPAAVAD
jgi:hypothetical protein